jgi:subtilisin family serine protease
MGGRFTLPAALSAWTLAVLALAAPAAAQDDPSRFAEGELVVRYEPGVAPAERAAVRDDLGATLDERLGLDRAEVVTLEPSAHVLAAAKSFERRPEIRYAEPNYLYRLDGVPDDPLIFEQAGLHDTGQTFGDLDSIPPSFTGTYDADIDAPEAWNISTGSPNVTIAIADSGIDYTHPDLAPNVVGGHDFGADDPDPFPQGSDHGTHVAGIAGAVGNNDFGVAGVSWQSRLMPLKVSRQVGGETEIMASDLAAAFDYATASGVQVVNASLGGADTSSLVRNSINSAPGVLFVVSAGNDEKDIDDPLDLNPLAQQFPCEHPAPNIICVAATNHRDELAASFSNWGATSVDLAAPGASILSTTLAGSTTYSGPFAFKSGTSMATPMVAGTAALIFGLYPGVSVAEVKNSILGSVDVLPSLEGRTVTGGRLNVNKALGGSGELDVETVVLEQPKRKTRKRHVSFTFESTTHRPVTFLCHMDRRPFVPCADVTSYRVGYGKHRFAVKAVDQIGREDPTPATAKFKVKKKKKKKKK